MHFNEKFDSTRGLVEENLIKYIEYIADTPQKELYDSMKYSLVAGGKRIRPVLLLETMDMLGADVKEGIPFACALEYIHTYSLIHDDLPAMDNDDLRRGKPTNHKVYGEAIAILAGDGLLNSAFEVMANELEAKLTLSRAKAMKLISECSGINGMIAGQIVDMDSEEKSISYDQLKYLHSKKTGALLRASVISGAVLSGASEEQIDALEIYSKNIGLAFQISDDILDEIGDSQVLGKNTGSDKENQKSTYVSLFGLEKAKELAKNCIEEAVESLKIFDTEKRAFLEALAWFIINREN